jgi:hypothetical protein
MVSASHVVTITPTVTIAAYSPLTSTRCQGAGTVTYATSATNNSSAIVYTLDAASLLGSNTIDGVTGAVTYDAAWTGTSTITATAAGCVAGAAGTVSTSHTVAITPTVTIAAFAPATSIRCQGAGSQTYSTIATNNSSAIVYSLDGASLAGFNTINSTTGSVTWAAGWSGTTTITATAAGCVAGAAGMVSSTHVVTITPTVTLAAYSPATSTRCQGAGTVTYATTASNSTSITYTLDGASLAGTNTIDGATGVVTWAAGWSGTTTITASAAGCNGPALTTHVVTINPSTGTTSFIAGSTVICQDATDENYTATSANSVSMTYSVLPASAGIINAVTGLMNWSPVFSGSATITATAVGLCGTTSADRIVTVNPSTGATTFTAGPTVVCQDDVDATYSATATNSTSIVYTVLPAAAGVIDPVTGLMNWAATFSGTATITATSTGSCGTTSANRTVTVGAIPAITVNPVNKTTC